MSGGWLVGVVCRVMTYFVQTICTQLKTKNCASTADSVTQSTKFTPTNQVQGIQWRTPASLSGDVTLRALMVLADGSKNAHVGRRTFLQGGCVRVCGSCCVAHSRSVWVMMEESRRMRGCVMLAIIRLRAGQLQPCYWHLRGGTVEC